MFNTTQLVKQINRRQFIKDLGILTALGYIGHDSYSNMISKLTNQKIESLPNYLMACDTTLKYKLENSDKVEENKYKHSGFVLPDIGYLTCAHCVNMDEVKKRTPFGIMSTKADTVDREIKYKGDNLEEILVDPENDIALFKPSPKMPVYPYGTYDTEVDWGEPVLTVGNPYMKGKLMRKGNVMNDVNWSEDKPNLKTWNIDNAFIPGDSGSFSVLEKDLKLLCMNNSVMSDHAGSPQYGIGLDIHDIIKAIKNHGG